MQWSTVAKISLRNLRHNIKTLRALNGPSEFFCPMVKANAYGHGDIEIAKAIAIEGVRHLGVARVEEGLRLRDHNIQNVAILVFDPFITDSTAKLYEQYQLTPVLSNWESVNALEKLTTIGRMPVHIKFNTGMGRLGFDVSAAQKIIAHFAKSSKLKVVGVCSHFLAGEDLLSELSSAQKQISAFTNLANLFKHDGVQFHIWNSGALIAANIKKENIVGWGSRPGIALYGVKPKIANLDQKQMDQWQSIELSPVMQVETRISHLQLLHKGESVSYMGTFVCEKDTSIAVLPIGYADGYPRHFSNRGEMLLRGKRVPVRGIVCMDYTMIEYDAQVHHAQLQLGESVVILGAQGETEITAEDLAEKISTNSYEILTNFSARVKREYYD